MALRIRLTVPGHVGTLRTAANISIAAQSHDTRRLHIPRLEQAFFIQEPLPDGDIDYWFAIAAMVSAGYDGYLAVERMRTGDKLTADGRSVRYVEALLQDIGNESEESQ